MANSEEYEKLIYLLFFSNWMSSEGYDDRSCVKLIMDLMMSGKLHYAPYPVSSESSS